MSRDPTEIRTARIGRLSRLPAFFALEGKRAVVAGGGQAATWKAELLSAAGARVDVFALEISDDMRSLVAALPAGAIAVHSRRWTPADFAGAAI
ncbi:MAG: NAD(P)-dependent oxidoreductase, partial [Xanthobacteraceae bacterium]